MTNPKSNQKLPLHVGAESYVTIILERIFPTMYVTRSRLLMLHTDLMKATKATAF